MFLFSLATSICVQMTLLFSSLTAVTLKWVKENKTLPLLYGKLPVHRTLSWVFISTLKTHSSALDALSGR